MIPPFDPTTGNLPTGTHEATWDEVVARYGYTDHRRALLAGLETALRQLRAAGCRRVYINGSFVSAIESPGDFDACWQVEDVDILHLAVSAPALLELRPPRAEQKTLYLGEFFPAEESADLFGTAFLDYFQRDKRTGEPKGIIVVELGGLP
jgi:hypothetical protein